MSPKERYISDPARYLSELEIMLSIFENSIIGKDPKVKELIKKIRESNDVNVHLECINELANMMFDAYKAVENK